MEDYTIFFAAISLEKQRVAEIKANDFNDFAEALLKTYRNVLQKLEKKQIDDQCKNYGIDAPNMQDFYLLRLFCEKYSFSWIEAQKLKKILVLVSHQATYYAPERFNKMMLAVCTVLDYLETDEPKPVFIFREESREIPLRIL